MKILIAEDHFLSRMMLTDILQELGQVHTASDGQETIDAYKLSVEEKKPYDLLCLDIMMPTVNGHEVLEFIREDELKRKVENKDGLKILVISALDDPDNVFKSYKIGATEYITKPIKPQTVYDKLREMGLETKER